MEKEKTQKNLMIPADFADFVESKDMFRFLQSILEYCQVNVLSSSTNWINRSYLNWKNEIKNLKKGAPEDKQK